MDDLGVPLFLETPKSCYLESVEATVDGNQKSGIHSPVEVGNFHLIYLVDFIRFQVVGNGISEPLKSKTTFS